MRLTGPTAEEGVRARRPGFGRAPALLALVTLGTLIPLLGPSAALHGTGEAAAPGAGGIGLLRAVLFAGLSVPLGELFVHRLARQLPGIPPQRPCSWAPLATFAGFAAALALAAVVSAGNLIPHGPGDIDVGRPVRLPGRPAGTAGGQRLPGGGPVRVPAAPGGPGVAAGRGGGRRGAARASHGRAEPADRFGSDAGAPDVCGAVGRRSAARPAAAEAVAREPAGAVLLGRYARVAAVLLAAITATGVCSSLRRMPPGTILDQLTSTAYGRTLLAESVLVAAVALLALWARIRLRRAPDPLTAYTPARAELLVLGAVVAVSGLLTALPLPIRWT